MHRIEHKQQDLLEKDATLAQAVKVNARNTIPHVRIMVEFY